MIRIPPRVVDALAAVPTPVCAYVYDRSVVVDQIARVRAQLPPGTELYFAIKANSHPSLLEAALPHVDGVEVASGGELRLAAAAETTRIVLSVPSKTDAELTHALRQYGARDAHECRVLINAESLHELRRIDHLARRNQVTVDVTLRINRKSRAPHGALRMTGDTVFGIDESQLGPIVGEVAELDSLRLRGFHLHAVSNCLDAGAYAEFVRDSVSWSQRTADELGISLEVINVGGGIGVDYSGSQAFDLTELGAQLPIPPRGIRLMFELGRFLTADAGWYAAEVVDLKSNHGRWFASLRGGTHHFRLPAAWRYSHPFAVLPVERWPYPFPRPTVVDSEIDIAGELCTPRDVLCRNQWVQRLRVGDVLVFARTGAYGWEVAHHDFLSHDPPRFLIL